MEIKPVGEALFIHIPRTAGNSIHSVSKVFCDHRPAKWVRQNYPDWNSVWTFSIVRNPWDQAVSWWAFNKKRPDKSKRYNRDRHDMTFDIWVRNNPNHWKDSLKWPGGDPIDQKSYITDNDEVIVDYVALFERIHEEWSDVIAPKMNIKARLPHKQKSARLSYREYYTDELAEIVFKRHQWIIERFGYTF